MNAVKKVEAAPQSVYAKIAAVQGSLAKHGIGKNRRNNSPGGNYAFRGIDDVYNALAPLLAENGLCVLPRILSREIVERKSAKGNPLFFVTVEAEFDFVSADDGSKHTTRTFGEAMDSSDKATNKAMSAAYKYAAFMTFAIPTEGDNDADATTHEVAPSAREGQSQNGAVSPPAQRTEAHSKLKTQVRAFVHDMEGCGDWDTWIGLRESKEAKALIAEVKSKLPQWWEGGPDMPEEFVPLYRRIELLEANLADSKAEMARA